MANKMADKRKGASQKRSQTVEPKARGGEQNKKKDASQSLTVEPKARGDEQDKQQDANQSQTVEPKARGGEQGKSTKAVTPTRDERKEKVNKPVAHARENNRRDNKAAPTVLTRLRSNRIVRFLLEAYYELRHKVTWPSFEQARNMTIMVILLSIAVGIILGLADLGLARLYLLIQGNGVGK